MEKPLVTVSLPLYNCESSIMDCMISVNNQTYENIEVLIVNDKTKDKSRDIVNKYILENDLRNWRIIDLQENGGLSVVRNVGIDEGAGKYIFFIDSDDEISPKCIEKMVEMAEYHNLQMVVGEVEVYHTDTGQIKDVFPISAKENVINGNNNIFEAFVKGQYPVSSWNKLINLSFLRNNKLYFTKGLFAQDALQSFETAIKLESIGFLREKTYRYYLHQNSVIHNRGEIHFNNWITIAQAIDAEYKRQKDPYLKQLILEHLIDFKVSTLQMNWKAKKDELLWKKSYLAYLKLSKLKIKDYFNAEITREVKKRNLFTALPINLGYKLFKWRYER